MYWLQQKTAKRTRHDATAVHPDRNTEIRCWLAPRSRVNLLPSPACGRGAGGEGAHWNMRFLQGFSLSLTLSHKWARGQNRVASSSAVIKPLRGEQIYRAWSWVGCSSAKPGSMCNCMRYLPWHRLPPTEQNSADRRKFCVIVAALLNCRRRSCWSLRRRVGDADFL